MSLITNKYSKWYFRIIDYARSQSRRKSNGVYYERHHILPRSLYPEHAKSRDNLVLLTAKEHYVCHRLLIKMTDGYAQRLMLHALGKFIQINSKQARVCTARQYAEIRHSISLARTGMKHTQESRAKMSLNMKGRIPWNKGLSIKPSRESIEKGANTRRGRLLSESHKENISRGKLGKPSGMLGKSHREETKEKIRLFATGRQHTAEAREKMRQRKLAYYASQKMDRF